MFMGDKELVGKAALQLVMELNLRLVSQWASVKIGSKYTEWLAREL